MKINLAYLGMYFFVNSLAAAGKPEKTIAELSSNLKSSGEKTGQVIVKSRNQVRDEEISKSEGEKNVRAALQQQEKSAREVIKVLKQRTEGQIEELSRKDVVKLGEARNISEVTISGFSKAKSQPIESKKFVAEAEKLGIKPLDLSAERDTFKKAEKVLVERSEIVQKQGKLLSEVPKNLDDLTPKDIKLVTRAGINIRNAKIDSDIAHLEKKYERGDIEKTAYNEKAKALEKQKKIALSLDESKSLIKETQESLQFNQNLLNQQAQATIKAKEAIKEAQDKHYQDWKKQTEKAIPAEPEKPTPIESKKATTQRSQRPVETFEAQKID